MKHTTLYRKWRPRRFGEVVGQEPVVRTLSRAIETGRVTHAYLFSGPRGTGKTSTAKVLAMGLNCENGPTPEPDGTCDSCRAIVNNSSLDVVEMDAASNRGIDEIRELRDRVNLAPVAGRKKVYIIDEVHMLTPEAFNALLKMLEEPPEHVVFVLATTEKHKVLPTIISRCQSFDFRRPGVETLKDKLAEIAEAEGIEVEPEALTVIAHGGGGSFRDAEGLLDQLSSFAEGGISASMVRELLGSVGPEALLETTAALHERRAADALRVVDRLSNEGKDLGQFAAELLSHLRNLMLLPYAPDIALAGIGADERGPLEEQANRVTTAEVVRLIEALGDARGRIKRGGEPKLELELSFLKLARDYTEPQVDSLLRRLEALELAVENGAVTAGPAPGQRQNEVELAQDLQGEREDEESLRQDEVEATDIEEEVGAGGDPGPGTRQELASQWGEVLRDLKERRKALAEAVFRGAELIRFDEDVLELEFPKELGSYAKERSTHGEELGKVLEHRLGTRPRLEFRVASSDGGDGGQVDMAAERSPGRASQGPPADDAFEEPEASGPEQARGSSDADYGRAAGDVGVSDALNGASGVQSEAARADDRIRSEEEVFNLALEWRDSRDPNGRS